VEHLKHEVLREGAPYDLKMGHQPQIGMAVSRDKKAMVSGDYWFHRQQLQPAKPSIITIKDGLIGKLAEMTGATLVS